MNHLRKNNETYLSHLLFAGKIGIALLFRGVIFILHAIFPICEIPRLWNLHHTSIQLDKWNNYTIKRRIEKN